MNVLVTGGAGYIGSHVCQVLSQANITPIVFDNLSTGHKWAVQWGPLVEADLSDPSTIRSAIRTYDVSAVIHLAASAYVGESIKDPRKYFENNARNTMNLLGAMLDEGIGQIVFSSTCATYGNPLTLPISEQSIQNPVNPYGESKLMIEKMLMWYAQAYGLRYVALRYFNAAGADPSGHIGEVHDPETHLIPLIIDAARGLRTDVSIFGVDYDTVDGTAIRDYVHVSDLAMAHVRSLQYLLGAGESIALNLGTGRGHSVREVIAAVERVTGKSVPVTSSPRRDGDPPVLVADASLAKEILGWTPQFTDLNEIISTAVAWSTSFNR